MLESILPGSVPHKVAGTLQAPFLFFSGINNVEEKHALVGFPFIQLMEAKDAFFSSVNPISSHLFFFSHFKYDSETCGYLAFRSLVFAWFNLHKLLLDTSDLTEAKKEHSIS